MRPVGNIRDLLSGSLAASAWTPPQAEEWARGGAELVTAAWETEGRRRLGSKRGPGAASDFEIVIMVSKDAMSLIDSKFSQGELIRFK